MRFSAELTSFEPGPDGVLATVRDRTTGGIRTVRADYLIAADGHRSGIRSQLGIGLSGPGALNHILCFVFEADLSGPLRGRHLAVGHFDRPRPGTSIISDREGRWVLSMPYRPEAEPLDSFTPQRCAELARAAVGVPGLELSLVSQLGDEVVLLGYEVSAQVAERFAGGRVFLAGDAAHAMPPPAPSGQAPASRTRTTWPGSSPPCCTARPGRSCWPATTPSGGRSPRSPWPSRCTCCASEPAGT